MTPDPIHLEPRIVEIGPVPIMWRAFPRTTQFFSTWLDERSWNPHRGFRIISLATLPRLLRLIQSPDTDLIVVHSSQFSPWDWRGLSRVVFRRSVLSGNFPLFRGLGPQLIRFNNKTPIAGLDLDDPPGIARSNLFLLDKATVFFKRELPPDHWRVFAGTVHRSVPTPRFRAVAKHQKQIAKLAPISLGISTEVFDWLGANPIPHVEKTTDVFFAGRLQGSSSVRVSGIEELLSLRAEGLRIDISQERLPIGEYLERCARARIVFAPEGFGWQSFRLYEAPLCGAVPLCNRPTIERYQPLLDGVHALYYDPEPGALREAVKSALVDRERLRRIAAAARERVLDHHTPLAIARHVAAATLARVQSS